MEQSNNWDLRATKEIERIENLITKIQNAKKDYDNELNKLLKLPFFKGAKSLLNFKKITNLFLKITNQQFNMEINSLKILIIGLL